MKNDLMHRLGISALLLLGLLIVGSIVALFFAEDTSDANTAIIQISGPIMATSNDGLFSDGITSSSSIIALLEEARDDPEITAIILEINSPGGSAVASDEIASAVLDVRASGKPVVAWIREVGASGAYWIASSSDHIVANRMSITGSIGVISSYIEFSDFLDEWNLTYNRLVAGDRKDIGDPFQELTYSDKAFLQEMLDTIHDFFIQAVATNRDLDVSTVRELGDGRMFLGIDALNVGLVDELGGKQEAIAYIESVTEEDVETTVLEGESGLFDSLFGVKQPSLEQSIVPLAR